jgi:hypothetical protein
MNIATILIADESNPVEVKNWIATNATATVISMAVKDNIIYILYK